MILPAITQGRRVVSNVYGLNKDLIEQYCLNQNNVKQENLGQLILVDNEQCLDPNFYPYKNALDNQLETFCKAGDLIIIDEAWRFFPKKNKIFDNHFSFISEHRHFTNEQGISCDFVIVNQDLSNLQRELVERIETTYKVNKLVSAGLKNRYRVDVYAGHQCWKTNKVASYQEKYDKAIFPLYKSYETENGRELVTDKRQNAFNKSSLKYIALITIIIFGWSFYKLWQFFTPNNETTLIEQNAIEPQPSSSSPKSSETQSTQRYELPTKPLSKIWRITGELKKGHQTFVILADNQNRLRLEPRSQFQFNGRMLQGEIDGQIVNYYSGVDKQ